MDLSQLPIDQLEKKVLEKRAWLEEIIDFVEDVTFKYGKQLGYKEHDCHTYAKRELNDVKGFSFMKEGSFTMFGGEGLKIWYQPPSKKDVPKQEVLHLEWWGRDSIHVRVRIDEKMWVLPLKRLMKNKKKIFPTPKQKKQQERQIEKKKQDERLEWVRRKELLEQAQKMGLC